MLKLENAVFSLEIFYNMHKTLVSGVNLIFKMKITICVGGTMIADKKCQSRNLKL